MIAKDMKTTLWVFSNDSHRCGMCGLATEPGSLTHEWVPSAYIERRPGCGASFANAKSKLVSQHRLEQMYPTLPCQHIEMFVGLI